MSGWRDLPALFRHCVAAVYNKTTGGGADGVVRAMLICRASLAKNGYLYPAPSNQVLENIQLTGKGWVRNQQHAHEGMGGGAKDHNFEALFKMIEPRLYELDGPGGRQPPKGEQSTAERSEAEKPVVIDNSGPTPALYPPPKK